MSHRLITSFYWSLCSAVACEWFFLGGGEGCPLIFYTSSFSPPYPTSLFSSLVKHWSPPNVLNSGPILWIITVCSRHPMEKIFEIMFCLFFPPKYIHRHLLGVQFCLWMFVLLLLQPLRVQPGPGCTPLTASLGTSSLRHWRELSLCMCPICWPRMQTFSHWAWCCCLRVSQGSEIRWDERTPLVVQWLRIHLAMWGHRFDPWSGS